MHFKTDDSNCSSSGHHDTGSLSSSTDYNSSGSRTKQRVFQEKEYVSSTWKNKFHKSHKSFLKTKIYPVFGSAIDMLILLVKRSSVPSRKDKKEPTLL